MAGANLPRISPKSLLGIPIPVPPLPEQERVVNLLDEADELRKLRARADRRTTELIPALFHEMFGDGESKYFLNVKLGEITEIKSGAGFPLDKQGRLDQPIPFFKVGDMNTQGNEWAMLIFQHTISEATRRELGATLLPANSIVFPKVGAAIGTNKKRVISRPSCVDNNVMAIIPGDRITPEFLLAMLKAKNLTDFASNSNPPSIRKTTVESWEIMLPPVSLQKEFANRVNETRKLEADQAASRLRLEALFQSLLHRAFNEEL
jgi:restriction endonuclease S subunit